MDYIKKTLNLEITTFVNIQIISIFRILYKGYYSSLNYVALMRLLRENEHILV